ncbi:MAG: energy transducer TonB [Candidatus Binatia bacterium]
MDARRSSLIPFLLISLALHLFLFFPWPEPSEQEKLTEQIPVTLLPSPTAKKAETPQKTRGVSNRRTKGPAQVAKKSSPQAEEIRKSPREPYEKENRREEPIQRAREKEIAIRSPLPTLKDLLPPVGWSSSGNKEGAVPLNTQEPKYVSYFTSIKRAIELVWEYPEPALRYGLQGKLVLEFTILGNGNLEGTRLIRSSGFSVLDQEAIRAVRAASPFHPIPPWIRSTRLDVIASFEYHDNRLKYGFTP